MSTEYYADPETIREWLTEIRPFILIEDAQDEDYLIGSSYSARELIDLYQTPNVIPDRRDVIAASIISRLECLLKINDRIASEANLEISTLSIFVASHLQDFNASDVRFGFGIDYECHFALAES